MAAIEDGRARFRIDTDGPVPASRIMILTTAAFAASDSTVKVIGATVPLLVLLWVRYLFQMIVLGTWHGAAPAISASFARAASSCRSLRAHASAHQFRMHVRGIAPSAAARDDFARDARAAHLHDARRARSSRTTCPAANGRWSCSASSACCSSCGRAAAQFSWTVIFPIARRDDVRVLPGRVEPSCRATDDAVTTNFLTALVATIVLCVLVWMDQAETLPALAQVSFGSWLLVALMATMATLGQSLMLQALQARAALRADALRLRPARVRGVFQLGCCSVRCPTSGWRSAWP